MAKLRVASISWSLSYLVMDWRKLGVNFINILRAAFTHTDFQSARKTVKLSVFFALSRSTCAKSAHRTLIKLTPGQKTLKTF